jgi:hypothetical protein
MRIISNYRDYYDFPNFGYDTDNRIVYERTISEEYIPNDQRFYPPETYNTGPQWRQQGLKRKDFHYVGEDESTAPKFGFRHYLRPHFLFICDKCYVVYIYDKSQIVEAYDHNKATVMRPVKIPTTFNAFEATIAYHKQSHWHSSDISARLIENMPPLNSELGSPVILVKGGQKDDDTMTIIKNPSLMALGFNLMSIEEIYQEIETFVGKSKDIPAPVVPDKEKVEAKGFDKKTSFRNPVK